jgi:hypothetical protein
MHLLPDLVSPVNLHVAVPDATHVAYQLGVALRTAADQRRITLAGGVTAVSVIATLEPCRDRMIGAN